MDKVNFISISNKIIMQSSAYSFHFHFCFFGFQKLVYLSALGKGSFEIKKKVKNFLNLSPESPPLPLKVKKDQNLFFFLWWPERYFLKKKKQAENGLQSRSSENGKTAVWHYGLKLQWYLTGDRDWRYGMVWYGLVWFWFDFVGIVWYGGGHMTSEFIHEEISIMDYNGLSWTIIEGGVMTGMDGGGSWLTWFTCMDVSHGWLALMTGTDDWHIWLAWMTGTDDWHGWLAWMSGMDDWHGWLAWMTIIDCHGLSRIVMDYPRLDIWYID